MIFLGTASPAMEELNHILVAMSLTKQVPYIVISETLLLTTSKETEQAQLAFQFPG